jgi:predicted nucleic acid-binding protein
MSQEQLGQRPAMGPALLDVNVLIALLDQRHVHHEPAHSWFALAQANGWASRATPTVRGQLTDTYLLALAVHHGGRLVSFDRRLSCEAVAGGREALWLLDG